MKAQAAGTTVNIMGSPLIAVAEIANRLAQAEIGLKAGMEARGKVGRNVLSDIVDEDDQDRESRQAATRQRQLQAALYLRLRQCLDALRGLIEPPVNVVRSCHVNFS